MSIKGQLTKPQGPKQLDIYKIFQETFQVILSKQLLCFWGFFEKPYVAPRVERGQSWVPKDHGQLKLLGEGPKTGDGCGPWSTDSGEQEGNSTLELSGNVF